VGWFALQYKCTGVIVLAVVLSKGVSHLLLLLQVMTTALASNFSGLATPPSSGLDNVFATKIIPGDSELAILVDLKWSRKLVVLVILLTFGTFFTLNQLKRSAVSGCCAFFTNSVRKTTVPAPVHA
jgi:hypothetical protein